MPDPQDVKPDIKPDVKSKYTVTVSFQGQTWNFQIKSTTTLRKVFDATEHQASVQKGTLKFLLDGVRLRPEDTLESLDVELDVDTPIELEAHLEQIGGGC
ncbi:hypothetical protein DL93DRAFT_2072982 [Clavulina sp. PMI_390]|nr:hypothetical protein DL93DRAFT_2072982 [Clavulina sp. PMI_390]